MANNPSENNETAARDRSFDESPKPFVNATWLMVGAAIVFIFLISLLFVSYFR
jgi:hypothetical protein